MQSNVGVRAQRVVTWLVVAFVPGCWLAIGAQDRSVARDEYPFVEAVTTDCDACVTSHCASELFACVESVACGQWPTNPVGTMPLEAAALRDCMRAHCFSGETVTRGAPCYNAFAAATDLVGKMPPPLSGVPPPSANSPSGYCALPDANFGNVHCDPVDNLRCKAGEACALDLNVDNNPTDFPDHTARFSCRSTGHVLAPGAECGPIEGQCMAGSDCFLGSCYRYCCGDTDCPKGQCYFFLPYPPPSFCLGVCIGPETLNQPPMCPGP